MHPVFQGAESHPLPASSESGQNPACRPQAQILLTTPRKRALRVVVRSGWLLIELALAALGYPAQVTFRREGSHREARARWLQRACRRLLRVFAITCRISGTVPVRGLLVCNHLSYLDILVLGAVTPCVFVAKSEVRHWPVFGWFARLAGTVFVRRDKRRDVARVRGEITEALEDGALVVLFPEGTSSGGATVLPFKPALLSSAIDHPHAIFAGRLDYSLDNGNVAEEVCYWRDMTLVPHLLNLLGKGGVIVHLSLRHHEQEAEAPLNRKELAHRLHSRILRLKWPAI